MRQFFSAFRLALFAGFVISLCLMTVGEEVISAKPVSVQTLAQDTVPLVILTENGKHSFQVELARTGAERERGLMFRHSLAPDGGMLFLFGHQDDVAMWMKNTFISLDMFFIDRHGLIVNIARQAEPRSLSIIRSGAPVSAVLELAGGTAGRLKINPGDRIVTPALKTE